MRVRNILSFCLENIIFLLPAVVITNVMRSDIKYIIGMLLSFLCFLIKIYLTDKSQNKYSITYTISIKVYNKIFDISFIFVYLLSILIIVFVPSISGLYSEWYDVNIFNYLRLLSSMLLTSFLPGFCVYLLFNRTHISFSILTLITISYYTSLFLSLYISIIYTCIYNYAMSDTYNYPIILMNLILIVLYVFVNVKPLKDLFRINKIKYKFNMNISNLILITTILIVSIQVLTVYIYNPLPRGDLWNEFEIAISMYRSGYSSSFFSTASPYFSMILITFFSLSGFSPLNFPLILTFVINVISILSFYLFISSFYTDNRYSLITTVFWSLFSGFGWIFVFFQQISINLEELFILWTDLGKYSGIIYMPKYGGHEHILRLLCISGVFILIYMLKEEKIKGNSYFIYMTLISSALFLLHPFELSLFIITFLTIYLVVSSVNFIVRLKKAIQYILCGLMISLLINLIIPKGLSLVNDASLSVIIITFILYIGALIKEKYVGALIKEK